VTGASVAGYGLPLKCPSCSPKSYYGCLKFSGSRMMKCDTHGPVYELNGYNTCRAKTGNKGTCNKEMRSVKAECPNCGAKLLPTRPKEHT